MYLYNDKCQASLIPFHLNFHHYFQIFLRFSLVVSNLFLNFAAD